MTVIRAAPDFAALNLTEEEEEEVYRAEQERYDEWVDEVNARKSLLPPTLLFPTPYSGLWFLPHEPARCPRHSLPNLFSAV